VRTSQDYISIKVIQLPINLFVLYMKLTEALNNSTFTETVLLVKVK
jgi:hypothetical protein